MAGTSQAGSPALSSPTDTARQHLRDGSSASRIRCSFRATNSVQDIQIGRAVDLSEQPCEFDHRIHAAGDDGQRVCGRPPVPFGAWTPYDVVVSLLPQNPISQSGVGKTYFAVDDPACTPQAPANCGIYTVPFVISASGTHTVSFFSENQFGAPEPLKTVVVRIDKDPPRMTCVATPNVLWAPNGKMIPVGIAVTAVDDVSGPAPFVLASFGASEGSVSDDMHDFVTGGPDMDGLLRAARFGFGPGRQDSLTYQSTDALGNVGTCAAIVTVPHDQRKEPR